jgi:cell division protein FtsQ
MRTWFLGREMWMDKSKIVALEDRIPKLKEQRRKKANRRLILLLSLFFTMIAIVAYVQSPLSHVKKIIIQGNELLSTNELIEITNLTNKTNIWSIKKKDIVLELESLSEIKKAELKVEFPNLVRINIQERTRIAYLEKDKSFLPVIDDGKILKNRETGEIPVNAPILFNFEEGAILKEMVRNLEQLPDEILNSISEIHYTPKDTDQYHISLFMNDGFEVSATLRSFSEKMIHYPSIVSQLDPAKKGIIDLEVGSYFKAYETEVEENKGEDEKGEG